MTECSIDGCSKKAASRGWCQMHYRRWTKHGNPSITLAPVGSLEDRLRARSVRQGDCLVWTGKVTPKGYGDLSFEGERTRAHRWAYRAWVGPIPEGAKILHSCDNPPCIEPTHLRPGTDAENMQDALDRNRRPVGPLNYNAVLTEGQVVEILRRHSDGEGVRPLAREFQVTTGAIGGIVYGKTWRHVPRTEKNHPIQQKVGAA